VLAASIIRVMAASTSEIIIPGHQLVRRLLKPCSRFEILMAVKVSMVVFWVETPCGPIAEYVTKYIQFQTVIFVGVN
jgi:hypothetical protein